MKQQQLLLVLGILIATLLLGIWMRKMSRQGFEDAPQCTYSEAIPGFLLGCSDNPDVPFACVPYPTLAAAQASCSINDACRGVVYNPRANFYSIRMGPGSTDYTNLQKMKDEMIERSFFGEQTYLITNLATCKPNSTAFKKGYTPPAAPGIPMGGGPRGGGNVGTGPAGGGQMPVIDIGGPAVTVPSETLLAVPAGQTIYAKRSRPSGGAQGVEESQPAILNSIERAINPPAPGTFQTRLTKEQYDALNITPEERLILARFPEPLRLKIVDAGRQNIPLREVLSPDELQSVRQYRANQQTQEATTA